jgi:hypothetical protein
MIYKMTQKKTGAGIFHNETFKKSGKLRKWKHIIMMDVELFVLNFGIN